MHGYVVARTTPGSENFFLREKGEGHAWREEAVLPLPVVSAGLGNVVELCFHGTKEGELGPGNVRIEARKRRVILPRPWPPRKRLGLTVL